MVLERQTDQGIRSHSLQSTPREDINPVEHLQSYVCPAFPRLSRLTFIDPKSLIGDPQLRDRLDLGLR
jgi:hypothetical protein